MCKNVCSTWEEYHSTAGQVEGGAVSGRGGQPLIMLVAQGVFPGLK